MRVVVDATGRTPARSHVYSDAAAGRSIVATTPVAAAVKAAAWGKHGAQVWTFAPDKSGRVPLKRLLKRLGDEGYLHVVCEGGGGLAGALHDAALVDEYVLFYAAAILGDTQAVSGVAGRGKRLKSMERMQFTDVRRIGEDIVVHVKKG
jgi:diaminohydroxyphosphoribosylaminopyrimidine deaminase/5-amino-6-(5-phosphoribosylamino)uracil reductase